MPCPIAVSAPPVESPRATTVYDFGEFSFDEHRLVLSRAGERLRLPRKVLEVLAALLRRNGDVVTREELMAEVWRGAHVEAAVLTQAIFLLRKTLGDTPSEPRFVATIPGRGYVFLGAVVGEAAKRPSAAADRGGWWRAQFLRSRAAVAAAVGAATLLAAYGISRIDAPAAEGPQALPSLSPSAREAYLEARHLLSQRNERGLELALKYFPRALELAPDFAPAHAGLAEAETLMGAYDYGNVQPRIRFERAELSARRAVELDPRSGEGWAILGVVSLLGDLDVQVAQRHLDRAITLAPQSARAHHWRAWVLYVRGRPQAAERELEKARQLDPLSAIIRTAQGTLSFYRGRLSESRAHYLEVLELEPTFGRAHLGLGMVAEQEGELATAEEHLRIAAGQLGDPEEAWAALAHLYGRTGRRAQWEAMLVRLGGDEAHPYARAQAWLGVGDERRALKALRDAIDERRIGPWDLLGDPRLRAIGGAAFDRLVVWAGLRPAPYDTSGEDSRSASGPGSHIPALGPASL